MAEDASTNPAVPHSGIRASFHSGRAVVLLFGPTGVGKTELLARLGDRIEVISADSVQVYRGLDIGSAKPGPEERRRIPHHLIDIRDPHEQFTVGDFVRLADEAVAKIRSRDRRPVVSGGTAYYLHAYLYGLAPAPPSDPHIREQLQERLTVEGLPALFARLRRVDPETAGRVGPNDHYRITRALEVYEQTGRPLSAFPRPTQPREGVHTVNLGLYRPRADLYERIDARVDCMIAAGLYGEVQHLVAVGYGAGSPGLRAIGYAEWFDEAGRLVGPEHVDTVTRLIKRNCRRYAKRQITFFSRLPDVQWVDASLP